MFAQVQDENRKCAKIDDDFGIFYGDLLKQALLQ